MNQTTKTISETLDINHGYYGYLTEENTQELGRIPRGSQLLAFAGIVRPSLAAVPDGPSGLVCNSEISGLQPESLSELYRNIVDPIKDQPLDTGTELLIEASLMLYQERAQRPGSLSYRHIGGLALIAGHQVPDRPLFLVANSFYRDFKSTVIDKELHSREVMAHNYSELQMMAAAGRANTVGQLVQTAIALRMPAIHELTPVSSRLPAVAIPATA